MVFVADWYGSVAYSWHSQSDIIKGVIYCSILSIFFNWLFTL